MNPYAPVRPIDRKRFLEKSTAVKTATYRNTDSIHAFFYPNSLTAKGAKRKPID